MHVQPFRCILLGADTSATNASQSHRVLLPSTDNSGLPQVPWYSLQRLPAHMTAPKIGRSPHIHFLGPSLTQTV